ncbi:hypothetical protein E1218_31760 [Kribbella turkmenica]|uniref:Uncharacterized protein n=1 Tax=Kribbella turkmenica TaxID=2530375 RepID=A0A4R4W957_9ACTN|nr:hypothetical protein E1218_31760 [Kribbella turkmenica]
MTHAPSSPLQPLTSAAPAETTAAAPPAAATPTPWGAVAALVIGAALLIYLNWPGPTASRELWDDEATTGWYVDRSWIDPIFVSSVGALVASLAARWTGLVALGIVAGCAVSVLEDGLLILGGGISDDETAAWLGSTGIAAAMAVVLLLVLRPFELRGRPVPPPGGVLVVAGGILLLVQPFVRHPDGFAFFDVTWLAVLEPFVAVGIAWLALAATQGRTRTWLTPAATTYVVIGVVAAVPALTKGDSPPAFLLALLGNLLVLAGVLSREWRLRSTP